MLDIVDALRELGGGRPFEPEHAPERAGEVQRNALDTSRARETFGWEPRTDLATGLRTTLESQ